MAPTMQTEPDGVEAVMSAREAADLERPPLLVLEPVTAFLDAHGLGTGPLEWARIGDGQSNVTYLIRRGERTFVLRRGPRPPLPRSTHDMVREARIQKLLSAQGIPVPEILAVCEDESLLGVPFYVMSHLDGAVITEDVPAELDSPQQRELTSRAVVDTLLQLHRVDVTRGELANLGRPQGYLRRQVERFSGLWDTNTTRELPRVHEVAQWLGDNVPETQTVSVVHGDYRMGNLMFDAHAPARVSGILDWEMATLGDPLADLGYLVATHADPQSTPTIMELTPVTRRPGYWTREQIVEHYGHESGLSVAALPWYEALALWKSAIFCEAIYTRWLNGERPGDEEFGPTLEAGVPTLLEQAATLMRPL